MSKKSTIGIVVCCIILSLLASVLFGRWLGAKLSTLPELNRLNILSPQTPIVINNQQVIRTSDNTDFLQAMNSVKSKLSTVVTVDANNQVVTRGGAVNATSDGVFV